MTRRHGLYAVFFADLATSTATTPTNRWVMERSRRRALRIGRQVQGVVRRMNLPDPSSRVWDAPTFRALSDQIADFTTKS